MSAPDIIRALEGQGYREFRKIEIERGLYEVKALNAQGRLFNLYVDGPPGRSWPNRSAFRSWTTTTNFFGERSS